MNVLDKYFQRPLVYDYMLATLACLILFALYSQDLIKLPKDEYNLSTSSDLSTIALTLAGFILTLLTILITFKASSKIQKDSNIENETVFNIFFATPLYFETTKHLKNCIKSLIFVSVLGYSLKLFLDQTMLKYMFFSNIIGLVILICTLWRSLLILTKIINMQKEE